MKNYVNYRRDQDGVWWREEDQQCQEEVLLSGRCQGAVGHRRVHWCYDETGCFRYDGNEADPEAGGLGAGMIPPGHSNYVHPAEVQKWHHRNFRKEEKVTDQTTLDILNQGEIPPDGNSLDGFLMDLPIGRTEPEVQKRLEEFLAKPEPKEFRIGKPRVGD